MPKQPSERKSFKIGTYVVLVASLAFVAGVSYLGYSLFIKAPPPPPPLNKPVAKTATNTAKPAEPGPAAPKPEPTAASPAATEPARQPAPTSTEPNALQKPAATETTASPLPPPSGSVVINPKTPIDHAQQVIAEHRAVEQGRIDLAIDGGATTDANGQVIPKEIHQPAEPPKPAVRPTFSEISPGISATNHDIAATPQAGPNFRRYVGDMIIRGVFQGAHPRAHINGRMVSQGEMVERNFGIVFESIDADKKTITFRDPSGATITRRY
jgi:hypothetical protein